jgi:hypothetical protein
MGPPLSSLEGPLVRGFGWCGWYYNFGHGPRPARADPTNVAGGQARTPSEGPFAFMPRAVRTANNPQRKPGGEKLDSLRNQAISLKSPAKGKMSVIGMLRQRCLLRGKLRGR